MHLTVKDARAFVEFVHVRCEERNDNAYDAYLDILNAYKRGDATIHDVKRNMIEIFYNDQDVLQRFNHFLDDKHKLDINFL